MKNQSFVIMIFVAVLDGRIYIKLFSGLGHTYNASHFLGCMLEYFTVFIIHRTLTWTTISLICVCDLFACV